MSIHQLPLPIDYLYQGLSLNPNGIAAQDDDETICYTELVQRVEALAYALQQLPCLHQGSHIGLNAQNHIGHLICLLAIIAGGFIWVPINPKNGAQLNRLLMSKSDLALLMSDDDSLRKMTSDNVEKPISSLSIYHSKGQQSCYALIEQYRMQCADFRPVRPSAETTLAIKFTGGTTGEPKGVMQSHQAVSAVVDNMQAMFAFNRDDCNLAVAPLTHGGSHYVLPILAVGGRHRLVVQANPKTLLDLFRHNGVSISFMPPTLIYKLFDQSNISGEDFPALRHLTYSAAPMPPNKIASIIDVIGPRLSTVYGQTEAPMTITAMNAIDMAEPSLRASVGSACCHSRVAVLDQRGQQLTAGQTGEIATRGDIVMSGYYQQPQQTSAAFKNGWLLTGDLGYLDSKGYLFLQGRSKEVIISGGFNIYPAEVENVMMALAEVKECAVFGLEDDYWGERVEAAVCLNVNPEANEEEQAIQTASIRRQIKEHLGPVKTPKKIHLLAQLPRNPVGKVVRREVKQLVAKASSTRHEI